MEPIPEKGLVEMEQWLTDAMATVPDYARFADVNTIEAELDTLAAEFPGVATKLRVGTSRLGDAICAVRIGTSERHALVFALPHPNEPVGGLTALHLARRLCLDAGLRERLGFAFTIVGCIDPDGLRLNEDWLAGPFTRTHYAQHFYRPAGDQQVEWTFPFDYRTHYFDAVLPETAALVRLIDRLRPEFMVSLHNSELGGAYYYLSRPAPELYHLLQQIPVSVGLDLDRGEPESPDIQQLADGIYLGMGLQSLYDWMVERNRDLAEIAGGDGSAGYAARYGTFTLLSEVPYWHHPAVSDRTPTAQRYADRLTEQGRQMAELAALLEGVLAAVQPALIAQSSPFASACRFFVPLLSRVAGGILERAADSAADRPATAAEVFSLADTVLCFQLRYGGMLLRLVESEMAIGNGCRQMREAAAVLRPAFAAWCAAADELEKQVTTLPIRSLVATQFGAILACAEQVWSGRVPAVLAPARSG